MYKKNEKVPLTMSTTNSTQKNKEIFSSYEQYYFFLNCDAVQHCLRQICNKHVKINV
jgi:hypothetical protein